jgi:protein-L-isoaspartate(D-aspartate) O-methyltransferase
MRRAVASSLQRASQQARSTAYLNSIDAQDVPGADPYDPRVRMRERQLVARGIRNPGVLDAMMQVPRERFVPDEHRDLAYADTPLPIGHGQTISQPYIVALMIEALEPGPDDKVLEIGGGSGYAAAVLSRVVGHVVSVERLAPLCERARRVLHELGYDNVSVVCADGTVGWADAAPYDGILVAAGGPEIPRALKAQLAIGGRLVIPVGSERNQQTLIRVTRTGDDEYEVEHLSEVRFVPLIGAEGWH